MNQVSLYKFLDPVGAKLTLGNGTFKHAKPSDFNDVEDLTISGVFPCSIEDSLQEIERNFANIIFNNLEIEPTCASPMKEKLLLIQDCLKKDQSIIGAISNELGQKSIYDVEHMKGVSTLFVDEINEHLQSYRVLCVTHNLYSVRMWEEYAKNYTGIALKIRPNLAKDSKFKLFKEVRYQDKRPALHENPTKFIEDSLFGDKEKIIARCLNEIVYTKTREWEHEEELRLAMPILTHEEPWNTLPYHPEEIVELYLGHEVEKLVEDEVVSSAKSRNPNIKIYRSRLLKNDKLVFIPYG
jgi:hypothetical protein